MLFGCTVTPDSEEIKLKSSNPEASASDGKIPGVLSGSCSARKCYFQGPWVSFVTTDEFFVTVTKITLTIGVL